MSLNSSFLPPKALAKRFKAGISYSATIKTAEICMAVGKESFDD